MNIYFKFLIVLFFFHGCQPENRPPEEIFIEEFNWKITVPKYFKSINSIESNKSKNSESNKDKDLNEPETLLVLKSNSSNYLEVQSSLIDNRKDGIEFFDYMNRILYNMTRKQISEATIDTTNSVELIDDLEFHKFDLKIKYPNNRTETIQNYYGIFDKKDLSILIRFNNDTKGKKMIQALKKSTFETMEE